MAIKIMKKQIGFKNVNHGFTIVELLVAMVISLIVMGGIYSTFRVQQKTYVQQGQTSAMQQNLRAAMFFMQRELRMAGCDPLGTAGAGISVANANSISFTEDTRGATSGSDPDGDATDANENLRYYLSSGNLMRSSNGVAATVAENIDALDFVFLDGASPPVVLNPGGTNVSSSNLSNIRSVEITIVARTGIATSSVNNTTAYNNQQGMQILAPQNDKFNRKVLTTCVKFRNL